MLPRVQGQRRDKPYVLVQKEGAGQPGAPARKILLAIEQKVGLEGDFLSLPKWSTARLAINRGQTVILTKPRRVCKLDYIEVLIQKNAEDAALSEEGLRPVFVSLSICNEDQVVVLGGGRLVLKIKKVTAPDQSRFGLFTWETRIVMPLPPSSNFGNEDQEY